MNFEKKTNKLTQKIAEAKDAFIIEEMNMNHLRLDEKGEIVWRNHVTLRLRELEDYKQQVKHSINRARRRLCHQWDNKTICCCCECTVMKILLNELGLDGQDGQ